MEFFDALVDHGDLVTELLSSFTLTVNNRLRCFRNKIFVVELLVDKFKVFKNLFLFLIESCDFLFKINKLTERNINLSVGRNDTNGVVNLKAAAYLGFRAGSKSLHEDTGLFKRILMSRCDIILSLL